VPQDTSLGDRGEHVSGQDDVSAGRGRVGRHRREARGIREQRDQLGLDPGRVEGRVVDEQSAAGCDDRFGVQALLTAAQR